jgi:hypothetical protein
MVTIPVCLCFSIGCPWRKSACESPRSPRSVSVYSTRSALENEMSAIDADGETSNPAKQRLSCFDPGQACETWRIFRTHRRPPGFEGIRAFRAHSEGGRPAVGQSCGVRRPAHNKACGPSRSDGIAFGLGRLRAPPSVSDAADRACATRLRSLLLTHLSSADRLN